MAAERQTFEATTGRIGAKSEWRWAAEDDPTHAAALHTRYADLAIVGQIHANLPLQPPLQPRPEEIVFESGRPVLVVPYARRFRQVGSRVLVAWDGGRAAVRAVNDALPFLQAAEAVTILVVATTEGPEAAGHGEEPGADIALHLTRHGVKVRVERESTLPDIDIARLLLSRAAEVAGDLIVMGCYGHSRMRELARPARCSAK